jgi:hypothetical protein
MKCILYIANSKPLRITGVVAIPFNQERFIAASFTSERKIGLISETILKCLFFYCTFFQLLQNHDHVWGTQKLLGMLPANLILAAIRTIIKTFFLCRQSLASVFYPNITMDSFKIKNPHQLLMKLNKNSFFIKATGEPLFTNSCFICNSKSFTIAWFLWLLTTINAFSLLLHFNYDLIVSQKEQY